MRENTCIFTGHRELPFFDMEEIRRKLKEQMVLLITGGIHFFGSGGALGFDLLAAEIVLELRNQYPEVKLIMILPCHDQDYHWSRANQARYRDILSQADKVIYTGNEYTKQCMHVRNRHLVDHASICIAYLTKDTGGTAYTVRYAHAQGLKVINLAD